MGKVFFRSMYVMFLWIILLINLIFAFDIIRQIPLINAYTGITSYSNKYFGMSTMIKFIQELDMEKDFPFLADIRGYIGMISDNTQSVVKIDWSGVWDYPINNIADFFVVVGNFFANLFKGIYVLISQIFIIVIWIVYYAVYLLAFWKVALKLISGAYFLEVPTVEYPDWSETWPWIESIMLPCQSLV